MVVVDKHDTGPKLGRRVESNFANPSFKCIGRTSVDGKLNLPTLGDHATFQYVASSAKLIVLLF